MLFRNLILLTSVAGLLVGCGGGSSTPEPVTSTTEEIKQNAIANIGRRFDSNAAAAGSVFNDNQDVIQGTTLDVVSGGTNTFPEPVDTELGIESQVKEIVESTLALGDEGEGQTTRTGNLITIDPDEVDLCADDDEFGIGNADSDCIALLQHLTVTLLAESEESGKLTYLFKNQNLLQLGYSPNSESLEFNFSTLRSVVDEVEAIEGTGESLNFPDVLTGSIKATTTATNTEPGSEAGSVSIEVVQPINIAGNDAGTTFSIGTGILLAMSADAATATGEMEIDIGAIQGTFDDNNSFSQFNLSGFSAKAQVQPDAGELIVSNLGIGRGPLTIKIDDKEALRVTMETLGFTVNEQSGELRMDGNLNLNAMIGEFFSEDAGFLSQVYSMTLPQGSTLVRQGDGTLKVGGVGPFSISLTTEDLNGVMNTESVVANVNECLADASIQSEEILPQVSVCQ